MKPEKNEKNWILTRGLSVAGGWHPLAARIRNRIPEEEIESDQAWEFTAAHIRRLKQLGITLLVGAFDRGLGETDQKETHALARTQCARCHRHGLKHGVYLANTIYYESMLKDYPDCEAWTVRTAEGRKTFYGGEQTWRWTACLNAPGWRSRMKREIEIAIREVRTDLLHFDNLGTSLEPEGCHCDHCQEAFRRFLLRRYPTAAAQRRRFGFSGLEPFRIPEWFMRFSPPWTLDRIQSPLLQEYIAYKNATVTGYIAELAAYARRLDPGILIDSNGQAIHGNNKALTQGRGDNEGQAAYADFLWEENPDYRPDDDPRAIFPSTRALRTMLFARRLGKPVVTSYRDEEELAFNMTFAGHPGINMHWGYAEPGRMPLRPAQPGVAELLALFRRQTALYTAARPAARVAIWRNPQSLALVSFATHLSACVLEQTLFNQRIPFSIVQDGFITPAGLRDFDLVIVPDVEFVSDTQVRTLEAFVRRGGGLLITERSGLYSEEPRIRRVPAFAPLFTGGLRAATGRLQENANLDEFKQFAMQEGGGTPACATLGRGRVSYLPVIRYVHGPRAFKSGYNVHYDGIDSRYWKEPHNTAEILATLDWLCPRLRPVAVHGAAEARLEWLALPGGGRALALFRGGKLEAACDVTVTLAARRPPRSSRLYTPEQSAVAVRWVARDGRCETILRGIRRHAVLLLGRLA